MPQRDHGVDLRSVVVDHGAEDIAVTRDAPRPRRPADGSAGAVSSPVPLDEQA